MVFIETLDPSMATDLAGKARAAFVDDDFGLAVDLYTQAISLSSADADLYADRAQAYIKLSNFNEAVLDANKAIELDASMAKAYLRKGTACIKLERYDTAKEALVIGASLSPNDSRFTKLIKECDEHLAGENGAPDGPLKPNLSKNTAHDSDGTKASHQIAGNLDKAGKGSNCTEKPVEVEPPKPKHRHSFYQKPDEVVVTIFAKGVSAKDVAIDFGEQILSVAIGTPDENGYYFQPRLFGKIVPDKCRYEVLSTKVEIRLVKAEPINWKTLEYSQGITPSQAYVQSHAAGSERPSYPSSKRRVTDWDKLEAQVKKEEKEEKLDGDAGVNRFFGDIYKNADEDMRRAMMKSFVESNGTVLSTNWDEVGAKRVEATAPSGMELKKWEY